MSTFVELVERLRTECAVTGPVVTTVQGTLPPKILQLKNWIITAWEEIQTRHSDWEFMRVASSHSIPQYASLLDPAEYSADSVTDWKIDSFRIAASGDPFDDSDPLDYVPYDTWLLHDGLDTSVYRKPSSVTVRTRDKALYVGPAADVSYELYYDYYQTPQLLSADADVPICPTRFHLIIVYYAMTKYGRYEAAPEVLVDGQNQYRRMLAQLMTDQLPTVTLPGFDSWR